MYDTASHGLVATVSSGTVATSCTRTVRSARGSYCAWVDGAMRERGASEPRRTDRWREAG